MNMTMEEEREWWEMRIRHPFVGDMQKRLDEFQEKLIAAGEQPVFVPTAEPQSLCKSLLGFDL